MKKNNYEILAGICLNGLNRPFFFAVSKYNFKICTKPEKGCPLVVIGIFHCQTRDKMCYPLFVTLCDI